MSVALRLDSNDVLDASFWTDANVAVAVAALLAGLAAAAPQQANLTPSAVVTAPLFSATNFSSLRRKIVPAAGSGSYVASYSLPDAGQTVGALVYVTIELPASANPTIHLSDGGGTLLKSVTSLNSAQTSYWVGIFDFDGAAWHCLSGEFQV